MKGSSDPAIQRIQNSNYETIVFNGGNLNFQCFFALTSMNSNVAYNGSLTFSLTPTNPSGGPYETNATTVPVGTLNMGGSSSSLTQASAYEFQCSAPPPPPLCDSFVQFTPTRASCGQNTAMTFSIPLFTDSTYTTINTASTAFTSNLIVSSSPPPVILNTGYSTPTTGGQITLTGYNLGVDGNFTSGEYANITIQGQTINCGPTVSSQTIPCTIPAGIFK